MSGRCATRPQRPLGGKLALIVGKASPPRLPGPSGAPVPVPTSRDATSPLSAARVLLEELKLELDHHVSVNLSNSHHDFSVGPLDRQFTVASLPNQLHLTLPVTRTSHSQAPGRPTSNEYYSKPSRSPNAMVLQQILSPT